MTIQERINFGWLPQIPDHRDMPLQLSMATASLPARVDLRETGRFPDVYDQGELGSCVAQAIAGAIQYEQFRQHGEKIDFLEAKRQFTPSRLFIYYGAREYLGTVNEDSGAMIRDGLKVVHKIGAPRETGWGYDVTKFVDKPPKHSYRSSRFHKITGYRAIPVNTVEVKKALAEQLTVVIGVAVFDSFFQRSGDVPMPQRHEQMLGGHAILVIGYDDAKQRFLFRNSWGREWGNNGHGTLPYAYVGSPYLGGDYWAVIDTQYKERIDET